MKPNHPNSLLALRGFTLLELLVVITIIGIFAGVTTLSFGAADHRRLRAEADRLKLAFNQAVDASLMQQITIGWFYDQQQQSYDFKSFEIENGWSKLGQSLFLPHSIQGSAKLIIDEFDSDFALFTEENETEDTPAKPTIAFLTSGEYTPFTVSVTNRMDTSFTLSGDGYSAVAYMNVAQ